ncbi:hypothetical protein AB0B85_09740 [Micromonospora sp. NPDC049044]|uniref:hypothetical protein n=1 Tax=Micromonospora sp. NPDC049044 TaxID=3154827 RepID=UPI0033EBEF40
MAVISRRKLVWGGVLFLLLAYVVLLTTTTLGTVWAAWWSGKSTTDMRLWWWPMLFWSRLGKGIQLLAGLVVILDVIDLDRLRRSAVTLDSRGRALHLLAPIERHRAKVYGVREELTRCLVDMKYLAARGGVTLDISSLRAEPSLAVSEETANLLGAVDVAETLRRMHAEAAKQGWRGAELTRRVHERIDTFLADQFGPGERGWSGTVAHQFQARTTFFGIIGLMVALAVTTTVTMVLISTTLSEWITASIAIVVFLVSVPIGVLPMEDWRLGGSLLAAWRSGCARILSFFAEMIGTARPGHVFRWMALWLFLAGMHFDLLAS